MQLQPILANLKKREVEMARSKTLRPAVALAILVLGGGESTAIAQRPAANKQSLAVACKWNDAVIFYDAVTGEKQTNVPIGHRPHEMAPAPGGATAPVVACLAPAIVDT